MTGRDFEIGDPIATSDGFRVPVAVPADLCYLEGHFPGDPIVPGIAQLVLVERAVRAAFPGLGAPRGVRRLKFSRRIDPGAELALELQRLDDGVRFVIASREGECSRGSLLY
jgi:3-hydroxymyristoyl/3-hydroxydecanoyl-(acyl carrier protein) dehydratase